MIFPLLILVATLGPVAVEDSPLSLADLEAYRVALRSQGDPSAPLVQFRDLWNHPATYAGKSVRVEGRVARIFRQPRLGEFPPMVETWVVSTVGDPFCLVFADETGAKSPEIGQKVTFSGQFIRLIQYRGGDTSRVVPLIVGPAPPANPPGNPTRSDWSWTSIDWIMGVGATAVVLAILAGRHLSRPVARSPRRDSYPVFIDGEPTIAEGGSSDDDSDRA